MKNKLVSIIIRTKNEERWLPACLRNVFKQTYKNIEVVDQRNENGKIILIVNGLKKDIDRIKSKINY